MNVILHNFDSIFTNLVGLTYLFISKITIYNSLVILVVLHIILLCCHYNNYMLSKAIKAGTLDCINNMVTLLPFIIVTD